MKINKRKYLYSPVKLFIKYFNSNPADLSAPIVKGK